MPTILHPYLQADLKYTISNPKCNFRYMNLLNKKRTKVQKGGEFFGNGKYVFDFQENDLDDMTIFFVGNKENCITGIINYEEPDVVDLNGFSYYKSCNITKDLERKTGTIEMMNTFIKYIKQKHSNINKIVLTDNTEIECYSPIYKKRLQLYNLYLFKYGCGYYEKYFNFKLIDDGNNVKHNLNQAKYKTITIDKEKVYQFLLKIFDKPNEKLTNDEITNYEITNDIDEFMNLITNNELAYKFIKQFDKFKLCYILNEFLDYIITENKLYKLHGSSYQKTI